MAGIIIHITDAGRAALVSSNGTGTNEHRVTQVGIGTVPFAFDPDMVEMPDERKRIETFGGLNVAPDTIHVTIQDSTADQYKMYAFGLYLESGVLFAVYVQTDPILEKSPAAQMLLAADIQFTEIDPSKLVFGDASFLNPPATETQVGVVKLATQAEVDAGKEASHVVTPATLKKRLDLKADLAGADFTGQIQVIPRTSKGYAISMYRNASDQTQAIKIGAAPVPTGNKFDNFIESFSNPSNAKWLVLGANTDAENTASTGGSLGIAFRVGNAVKASITQNGSFIIGYRTVETGNALLQVDGAAYVSGAILRGNPIGILNGSTDVAGIQNFGTFGNASINNARFSADAIGSAVNLGKSRGATIGAHDAVQAGDTLASINFTGSDGVRLVMGAAILASAADTFTASSRPTRIDVHTVAPGAVGSSLRMRVNELGRVLIGKTADDGTGLLQVAGYASAQTPPGSDVSSRVATTEWVVQRMAAQAIGTIILEVRTSVRAGCLKLNGALLKRTDYPELWAYALASGAIVADVDWGAKGFFGCFSHGDGATTFRIPEFRGEFPRFWDDGRGVDGARGIGTHQMFLNAWHAHGASTDVQGDHAHGAWTDAQGDHSHYVNDPGHAHQVPMGRVGVVATSYGQGWGPYNWDRQDVHGTWGSGTGIWLNSAGQHGHNVGIGVSGAHAHNVTIGGDGGNEARPRNLAVLAMIRAYS